MCRLGKWYIQTDIYKWYIQVNIEGGTTRICGETQPKKQTTTKTSTSDTSHTLTIDLNPKTTVNDEQKPQSVKYPDKGA